MVNLRVILPSDVRAHRLKCINVRVKRSRDIIDKYIGNGTPVCKIIIKNII